MAIQKILIVDDSPTERYFLTDILVKNGFSVSTAENGEEALVKIKADKPHLILMDVVMPGQNGFQITRAIARDPETQDVPVIICTSKNQETDRIWAFVRVLVTIWSSRSIRKSYWQKLLLSAN